MLRIAQGLEGGLARQLEGHEHEAEEIQLQHGHTGLHHGGVIVENAEEDPGHQHDQAPGDDGVHRAHPGVEPDAGADPVIGPGTVVEADDRLGTADDAGHREHEDLPDGIGDGHDANEQVAAEELQCGIAGHLDQEIGALHDEVGGAQLQDLARGLPVRPDAGGSQGHGRLVAEQKPQDPHRRHALGEHRGQSRARHAHVEDEDEHRVQEDIRHRADDRGIHADLREALGVDVAVEARGGHGEDRADEVNVQIGLGVDVGCLAGTEGEEDGAAEQISCHRQHRRSGQQQSGGIAQNAPGLFRVPRAPGHGEQGHAAGTEEGRKGHDEGDDGKGQAHARQGQAIAAVHVADVDPVHHII